MKPSLTEAALVARFRSFFSPCGPVVRRWGGEDAAWIAATPQETVACVDQLVEGVHFRLDWSSAEDVGYKAVAVNYSDLASCGAEPLYIMLGLTAPRDFLEAHLEGFYAGINRALASWGGAFAGGDYTNSDTVCISLSAVGVLPLGGGFWARDGAVPGDHIYLSGRPGAAALALRRLAAGRQDGTEAQRVPDPPLPISRYLRSQGIPVSSCCDTSDGLSTSLHLLASESGCRTVLDADALPHPEGEDGYALALHGGEDYGLLFTTSGRLDTDQIAAETGIPVTMLGRVEAGSGVKDTGGNDIPDGGYDHLS